MAETAACTSSETSARARCSMPAVVSQSLLDFHSTAPKAHQVSDLKWRWKPSPGVVAGVARLIRIEVGLSDPCRRASSIGAAQSE